VPLCQSTQQATEYETAEHCMCERVGSSMNNHPRKYNGTIIPYHIKQSLFNIIIFVRLFIQIIMILCQRFIVCEIVHVSPAIIFIIIIMFLNELSVSKNYVNILSSLDAPSPPTTPETRMK